ncbi:MAG TPA: NAD(P)H-dependent oxidoreductase [Candidatus Corynebacterium avicola]|uniref:NAD(P)H-dependent oxidoreductase n=1 Tax=Candidatus Corynebacterium avicola TaxID=2838527 RepID=A0A9D1UL07_9CORY|nr:NAD(P)H-dependent oxidoreductase [Candidatus Corynebacterium avicola]
MAHLLIVHHSPTEKIRGMAQTVIDAAKDAAEQVNAELPADLPAERQLQIVERDALHPDAAELAAADAVLLGTTANFGYISGALKHYFDSTYVENQGVDKMFSYWIRGGYDTTGAEKAMESISTGFGWTRVADPVVFTGDIEPHQEELVALAQNTVGAWFATVE